MTASAIEAMYAPFPCTCEFSSKCDGDGWLNCRGRAWGNCFCICGCTEDCGGCENCIRGDDDDAWDDDDSGEAATERSDVPSNETPTNALASSPCDARETNESGAARATHNTEAT